MVITSLYKLSRSEEKRLCLPLANQGGLEICIDGWLKQEVKWVNRDRYTMATERGHLSKKKQKLTLFHLKTSEVKVELAYTFSIISQHFPLYLTRGFYYLDQIGTPFTGEIHGSLWV